MSILHRYITVCFGKYFAMVLIMVVGIYLSVDFLGRIDNFLEDQLPLDQVALYFLLKLPLIISQIAPVGVLLSVLIIFGLMNKHNEIIALKSGGISVFYLLTPVVVLGLVCSLVLFVFSEIMVPLSAAGTNRIEEGPKAGAPGVEIGKRNIWLRSEPYIVHVKHYHPEDAVLSGVSLYLMDEGFGLVRRLDAAAARYQQPQWVLFDCLEQNFGSRLSEEKKDAEHLHDKPRMAHHDQKRVELRLVPADFRQMARESDEMSVTALYQYIRKAESEGYDAAKYRVDFYGKFAFPLVCLIMSLMGAAVALRGTTRDGMAVSFAYGIIIAFVYWSVYSFCLSLGYGGMLPAWLAPWCANVLFGLAAVVMVLHLE